MEDLQFNETILYLNAEFIQTYTAQRRISDVLQDLLVHPLVSGNLSTNHDAETKHAPAVLVTIYKTLRKELWFIKAGRFSLFYKYGEGK